MKPRIVMLCNPGKSSNIIYNFLKDVYHIEKIIIEKPQPKKYLLKRRIKKLGIITVVGQIIFSILSVILKKKSMMRINEILSNDSLSIIPPNESLIFHVEVINSPETITILKKINPDLVIISGTSIIKPSVINSIISPFVNVHCGITPAYRGVHGAYWALSRNDSDNVGVTIHLVNSGIDTGPILAQKNISVTPRDNFTTYPLLQLASALPLLLDTIEKLLTDSITIIERRDLSSSLWYHPTIWGYLFRRIIYGVK